MPRFSVLFVLVCLGCGPDEAPPPPRSRETQAPPESGEEHRARAVALRTPGVGVPRAERFEPVPLAQVDGFVRVRGWATAEEVARNESSPRSSLGNWLCRLWTLYGPPPRTTREGFVYALRDRATGEVFSAYVGSMGPSLGLAATDPAAPLDLGAETRRARTVDAFVTLVDATAPRDCGLDLEGEFGRFRVGVERGEYFERTLLTP